MVHDGGGVAAQLQQHLFARQSGAQAPPHGIAAREADHGEARVVDQRGHHAAIDREHADRLGGPARLHTQLAEADGGGGRLFGGLDHHRAAGRDGRGDLVGHEVQREVERRDGEDGAARKATEDGGAAHAAGRGVEPEGLAGGAAALVGREREGVDGAAHLAARELDGLAAFIADQRGELLGVPDQQGRHAAEDLGAAVGRHGTRGRKGARGRGRGCLHLDGAGLGHLGERPGIPGREDLERGGALARTPREQEGAHYSPSASSSSAGSGVKKQKEAYTPPAGSSAVPMTLASTRNFM